MGAGPEMSVWVISGPDESKCRNREEVPKGPLTAT